MSDVTTNDAIREQVTLAVGLEWPAFAERHPALAAALDQPTVVEATIARLADDPAYLQAMADADRARGDLSMLMAVIRGNVSAWLARLV